MLLVSMWTLCSVPFHINYHGIRSFVLIQELVHHAVLPLGFWLGWDWSFSIHNLHTSVGRNFKIFLHYIYMLIQNISDVSMRRCNFAEYVFHTWPKTSCFSTPRLVTRMKTGLTLRMYKMSDWYSFLPPLTLVLLLHDHKFPWQEHVHDRLPL